MKQERIKINRLQDIITFDKAKAESYQTFYSKNYYTLEKYISRLEKLNKSFLFRFSNFPYAGYCILYTCCCWWDFILPALFTAGFIFYIYLIFTQDVNPWVHVGFIFILCVVTFYYALIITYLKFYGNAGPEIKNLVCLLSNLNKPDLIPEKTVNITKLPDEHLEVQTETSKIIITPAEFDYYHANGKSDTIYRVTNVFEINDQNGERRTPEDLIDYLKSLSERVNRILSEVDSGGV
ncbi:hypothetical protein KAU08_05325 [bacterium]|nr:hypothetical protein [bacterium]